MRVILDCFVACFWVFGDADHILGVSQSISKKHLKSKNKQKQKERRPIIRYRQIFYPNYNNNNFYANSISHRSNHE